MCNRWNRSPFLPAGIRVQLVGRCAMVSFGLDNNSETETMFCASKEVCTLVKVLKEYTKRCCWIMLREKIVTLLIMTTEYPSCT
jgi:hypothetical protein